jgi:hypothetical protein
MSDINLRAIELAAENRALKAENAALRARAVPAIVWEGEIARAGSFGLTSNGEIWFVCVKVGEQVIVLLKGKTGGKPACEAAFLRLVGCS